VDESIHRKWLDGSKPGGDGSQPIKDHSIYQFHYYLSVLIIDYSSFISMHNVVITDALTHKEYSTSMSPLLEVWIISTAG